MAEAQIKPDLILDVLSAKAPALSSTNDMPVLETKPDSSPAPEPVVEAPAVVDEPAAPDPEEDAGKTPDAESATAPTEEEPGAPDAEPKKQSRGVQKKLDELRREAEDAKRDARSEREERLRMLTMLEQQQSAGDAAAPASEPEDTAPEKPNRADYPDDDEWDNALMDYADTKAAFTARQEINATIAAERQRSESDAVAQAQEQVRAQYQTRIEAVMEKHPDFHEVAESPDVIVSMPVAHAILHSEQGPELQYYLGSHPDEAKAIMQLAPPLQLVEMGKIASKLSAGEQPAPAPTPAPTPPPQLSAAPPPITPLRSGDSLPLVKDPQNMTMDEYKAHRVKQGAEARR